MTICSCPMPNRHRRNNWCMRCWHPIVPDERTPRPPSGCAVPGDAAGEATISPAAFSDDYTEAWSQTEGGRIKAAFEKRTGRA